MGALKFSHISHISIITYESLQLSSSQEMQLISVFKHFVGVMALLLHLLVCHKAACRYSTFNTHYLWCCDVWFQFLQEDVVICFFCVCMIQDHCALEGVSSVTPWVPSHQLWTGGHGPEVHHRPHMQRLYLCLWVWHLHQAISGSEQIHTNTHSAPFRIIALWVDEKRNVQRKGVIEKTHGG